MADFKYLITHDGRNRLTRIEKALGDALRDAYMMDSWRIICATSLMDIAQRLIRKEAKKHPQIGVD